MNHPWVACLGWVFFHFMWQAAIAAGALWLASRLLRHASARGRYACAWLGLLICAALPLISLGRFLAHIHPAEGYVETLRPLTPWVSWSASWATLTIRRDGFIPIFGLQLPEAHIRVLSVVFPMLAALWIAGSLGLLWRFRRGWSVMVLRMRHASPAPDPVGALLRTTAEEMKMEPRRIPECLQSAALASPVVMGVFRPVVVVPLGFGKDFSAAQQRMLLAHELAHIVRGDTWHNAVQCVMEMFFFWHPAALWISRCVRHEREMCCDELAACSVGHPHDLARALAHLAEAGPVPHCLTLAANRGSLLQRIRLLLQDMFPPSRQRARLVFAFATMPLALLAAFYAHVATGPYRAPVDAAAKGRQPPPLVAK